MSIQYMTTDPSYWPPGWSRERFIEAPDSELLWSEEQRERFREGLLADVGEEGRDVLLLERNHRQRVKKQEQDQQDGILEPPPMPNFITTLQKRGYFRDSERSELFPWGWVVFRTGGYGEGQSDRVARMKERWDENIEEQFQYYDGVKGLQEAKQKFCTHWIEAPELEGVKIQQVAQRNRDLAIADGFQLQMCLMVDDESIDSILESPLPGGKPRKLRKDIPWCIAVDSEADRRLSQQQTGEDIDGADFKGWFRTAVETLINELWVIVAGQIIDVHHIAVGLEDSDVWCSIGRFGVHKTNPGVSGQGSR